MSLTQVIAAVVQRENRYLICQRPSHKRHGGLWEFPGGKLEAGETYLHAAQRELAEGLGVKTLTIGSPLFAINDAGSEFVIAFVPTVIEGDPVCLEHIDLKWMSLDELPSLQLAPSNGRFVQFLRSKQQN